MAIVQCVRVRIVRLANFVTPSSGGLRTTLRALGEGYVAAGHEPVLVVPGDRANDESTPAGRVITVRGARVPLAGDYRVMLGRHRLTALLNDLKPDRLEVSDRFTLRWTGKWARSRSIPAMMVSHESLHGLLGVAGLPGAARRWATDRLNARTAHQYDTVLCTTAWAAAEFDRLGVDNVVRVPLGVDLELFHPRRRDPALRRRYARPEQVLLVHCGRLSVEKRPGRSVDALASLRSAGVDAVLVIAGDGPLRDRLTRRAAGLPVHFLNFVADKVALASLLATADIVVAPGPIETFGLAALEAMACGTPVVVDGASALPEVVGDGGVAVHGEGPAFADAITDLLGRPTQTRRSAARRRAEQFGWHTSVDGFLAAHGATHKDRAEVA
jgi:alpha-1,6-mannosyltransferase